MDLPLEVPCPQCGSTIRAAMIDVAQQRTKTCSRGHRVELVDKAHGARKAQRELDKLERTLKRLGRKR